MDLNEILDILVYLAAAVAASALMYFYYANTKVKTAVDAVLKYAPFLLNFAQRFVKDDKGKFDDYDVLAVTKSVVAKFQETVSDPTNTKFEDVEEEIGTILLEELAKYKNLPGVPDLSDSAGRAIVKAVFDALKATTSED